jgi:hypothetical protein
VRVPRRETSEGTGGGRSLTVDRGRVEEHPLHLGKEVLETEEDPSLDAGLVAARYQHGGAEMLLVRHTAGSQPVVR